jgi:predicted ester cyclase
MTTTRRTFAAAALVLASVPGALAQNNDRAVVEAFYADFLNVSGPKDKAAVAAKVLAENWKSIGDYVSPPKGRDAVTQQIMGFHKLIPDLGWKIEDMVQAGNKFVVRGRATGTPKGPLFGVDGAGKSFSIMSIDIHEVSNGKIVVSYHVEDWAGALRQLSGK